MVLIFRETDGVTGARLTMGEKAIPDGSYLKRDGRYIIGDAGISGDVVHNLTTGKQGGQANEYYHLTAAEYGGNWGAKDLTTTGHIICDHINVNNYVNHTGDANTYMFFSPDRTQHYVGGKWMLDMNTVAAQDYVKIGDGTDVDINLNDDLTIDGATGAVTIANGGSLNLYEDITFLGATTENKVMFPDNLPVALDFTEAGNSYLKFVTTNTVENVWIGKDLQAAPGKSLYLGPVVGTLGNGLFFNTGTYGGAEYGCMQSYSGVGGSYIYFGTNRWWDPTDGWEKMNELASCHFMMNDGLFNLYFAAPTVETPVVKFHINNSGFVNIDAAYVRSPESYLQIGSRHAAETVGNVPLQQILGNQITSGKVEQTMLRMHRKTDAATKYGVGVDFVLNTYGATLPAQTEFDVRLKTGSTHVMTATVTVMRFRDTGDVFIPTGYLRPSQTWHAYGGFEDEGETIACGVGDWNHITNVANDLWNLDENDGITEAADVFSLTNGGDYKGALSLSLSALQGKDYHVRVYNNTQARAEGRPIGISTMGAGNEVNVSVPIYIEGTAADAFQFEIMSADGTDPDVDDAIFWIDYEHE